MPWLDGIVRPPDNHVIDVQSPRGLEGWRETSRLDEEFVGIGTNVLDEIFRAAVKGRRGMDFLALPRSVVRAVQRSDARSIVVGFDTSDEHTAQPMASGMSMV